MGSILGSEIYLGTYVTNTSLTFFQNGEPRPSEAIYDQLEAFWGEKHFRKCVQSLILHKIKVLKLFKMPLNGRKWPRKTEAHDPAKTCTYIK